MVAPVSTAPSAGEHHERAIQVMRELRALSTVQDRLDQYAAQQLGLNRTDLRALDLIGQKDGISPTALATALGMSTGATSAVLDRLEADGYARREPDPRHRRRTLVRTTARADLRTAALFEPVISATLHQASRQPDSVLSGIARFLAEHRELLERYLTAAGPLDDDAVPDTKPNQMPAHRRIGEPFQRVEAGQPR